MCSNFNKNFNISYYNNNLKKPPNKLLLNHYLCSCIIYFIFESIFLLNPYYKSLLPKAVYLNNVIPVIFLGYVIFAPVFLFILKPKSVYASHSIEVINYFINVFKSLKSKKFASCNEILSAFAPTYHQKQSIILYLIKLFFAPLLLTYTISHTQIVVAKCVEFKELYAPILSENFNLSAIFNYNFCYFLYLLIFSFLLLTDCVIFSIGYCSELELLKNKIKTVDTSFAGIFFCLICYPPFNETISKFFEWYHPEFELNTFNKNGIGIYIYCFLILSFTFIYVCSSIAMGFKASNLTNRGIVDKFPYNIVRHPAYASKVGWWWICSIFPIYNFIAMGNFLSLFLYILSAITWTFIYYMRAITEEKHLSLDLDYIEYTKRVKYRFIPKIW